MTLENEAAVIRRCQEGEIAAFEAIYRHYEQPMLAVACRMLGNQQEAEDALQDAFLKMHRNVGRFRFDAAFSTWFYRIVMNACYDRIKKSKRAAHVPLDEAPEVATSSHAELQTQLQAAIAQLPPKMRSCFVLFAVQGFKQTEIAEILDLKVGTIKAQVFEAKARLRETLRERLRPQLEERLLRPPRERPNHDL